MPIPRDGISFSKREFRILAVVSASVATVLVVALGLYVVSHASVDCDPGIFSVACPFIFLFCFAASFVTMLVIGFFWKLFKKPTAEHVSGGNGGQRS